MKRSEAIARYRPFAERLCQFGTWAEIASPLPDWEYRRSRCVLFLHHRRYILLCGDREIRLQERCSPAGLLEPRFWIASGLPTQKVC